MTFYKNDLYGLKYYRLAGVDFNEIEGEISAVITLDGAYPVSFNNGLGFTAPGYDGTITSNFNNSTNFLSGTFEFIFKDEDGNEIEVTEGVYNDIDITPMQ